jgi:hypothetical protein
MLENRDTQKDAAYALIIEQQQQDAKNALQIEQTGYTPAQLEAMEGHQFIIEQYYNNY